MTFLCVVLLRGWTVWARWNWKQFHCIQHFFTTNQCSKYIYTTSISSAQHPVKNNLKSPNKKQTINVCNKLIACCKYNKLIENPYWVCLYLIHPDTIRYKTSGFCELDQTSFSRTMFYKEVGANFFWDNMQLVHRNKKSKMCTHHMSTDIAKAKKGLR